MNQPFPNLEEMQTCQQEKNRLPALYRRAQNLRSRLQEVRQSLADQKQKIADEQLDVDRLDNRSLGNYLLSLSRQMDKRRQKEEQELIQARRKLEDIEKEQAYLLGELKTFETQIAVAQEASRRWEQGIQARLEWLARPENQAHQAVYQDMQAEIDRQQVQLTEISQAQTVADRAENTARAMIDELDSADNWSTYDVWFKGGIISHAAKYDHLDKVSDLSGRLNAQLSDLRRELADIDRIAQIEMNTYSSGTRVMDYFFDNIFTDLSVRDRVREDLESVRQIMGRINRVKTQLNRQADAVKSNILSLTARQQQFLLELGED